MTLPNPVGNASASCAREVRSSRTRQRPTGNLPLELTSFVGREREMEEVKRLLKSNRLLTLTGPGSCGKTRLALRAAEDLTEGFEDGAWWVGLSSLADPELIPQAVALALGVRELAGRDMIETLSRHLEARTILLVLDNCEHLVETSAELAGRLLGACPELRVLATSRETLGVGGEAVFGVPPLSMPDRGSLPSAEELVRYEAARLFVERAGSAGSGFVLDECNAPAVARLCQGLDGLPLAIELAASRARVLSAQQIAERLDDRFGLLITGPRTAQSRHRTLRATVDWSHDLLPEKEKILFKRASVFAGGFSLPAAEAVCSGEGVEGHEVLDLLGGVVDRSLVVAQERGGEVRYRLLETIRQYASEKLEASEEAEAVRERHAKFFLRFAGEAEPHLNGGDRGARLGRVRAEHDNLRAALSWSLRKSEDTGLRMAGDLFWFWFHSGYWSEGRRWLEGALAGAPARTAPRAKALYGAGFLAWTQGDHAAARSQLEESVGLWRELGDGQGLAHALHILGMELLGQGEHAAALSLAEESVRIFREGEDDFGLAISLASLGVVALNGGDHATARAILEESVAICQRIGDRWAISLALRNLGISAFREGDLRRAEALLKESLVVLRELGEKWFITRSLEHLAVVASMRGATTFGRRAPLRGGRGPARGIRRLRAAVLPRRPRPRRGRREGRAGRGSVRRGLGRGPDAGIRRGASLRAKGSARGSPNRLPCGAHRPGGGGPGARGHRADQRPGRREALPQPPHRQRPPANYLLQAGRGLPRRRRALRRRARSRLSWPKERSAGATTARLSTPDTHS